MSIGEFIYKNKEEIINVVNDYIGKITSEYYKDVYFISNPVLTRNPFASSLIIKFAFNLKNKDNSICRLSSITLGKKLFKYYLRNLISFLFFLFHFFSFQLSKLRFNSNKIDFNEDLIVINTFTMIDKILPNSGFNDPFFGNIYEILSKMGKQYVLLCILFGDKKYNLRRRWQTYNILAGDRRDFITEFELLTFFDYIRILWFIFFYPFIALKLLKVKISDLYDNAFKNEIINTLDRTESLNYVRYLAGKRLKKISNGKINIISWYENQEIDKLLFRGLRDSNASCYIYGCQFFPKYPLWLNPYPLEIEKKHDVLPDEILVSGKFYLNGGSMVNYKKGMSPRYSYLFNFNCDCDNLKRRDSIAILLTYSIEESRNIIKIVSDSKIDENNNEIYIKLHPNHLLNNPGFELPDKWISTNERLEDICRKSKVVISACSGTILEATSMGCSSIVIGDKRGLTFNPMPDIGKGEMWDVVFDSSELGSAYEKIINFREKNLERIIELSKIYKDSFFYESNEENFIKCFNL